jgi:anthranilate/para-aminobenzoate synthase component II
MGATILVGLRTLLIDNYDSYTFNLFHLLGEVNGREPVVVRNDELSWEELAALGADNVVISPGPGRPERARDAGVSLDAIRRAECRCLACAWATRPSLMRRAAPSSTPRR